MGRNLYILTSTLILFALIFLESLPPSRLTQEITDVEDFFQQIDTNPSKA